MHLAHSDIEHLSERIVCFFNKATENLTDSGCCFFFVIVKQAQLCGRQTAKL